MERNKERYGDLTPLQERLLGFFVFNSLNGRATVRSKSELAEHCGCSMMSIDRAVQTLRAGGYIAVEAQSTPEEGQIANIYTLTGDFAFLRRNPNPPQRAARANQSVRSTVQ